MKKLTMIILLVFACTAQAGERQGFQTLPFGATWEQAREYAAKHLGDYPVREFNDAEAPFMEISDYPLGSERVKVSFNFDHKRRFYGFSFTMTARPGSLRNDVNFIIDVFKKKYGTNYLPSKSRSSDILYSWKHPQLSIFVAFMNVDDGISAYGSVSDLKMAAAFHKHLEAEEKRAREDRAGSAARRF